MAIQFCRILIIAGLFLLLTGQGIFAGAEQKPENIHEEKAIDRFYDPVEMRTDLLEDLVGKKIETLRLYSHLDGTFRQVPFQFDEWTVDGWMVFDGGEDANPELANGLLDRQDMLSFYARDAGDRVSRAMWPEGAGQGIEIEIKDPLTDGKGWYYLLHFPESAPEIAFKDPYPKDENEMYRSDFCTFGIIGTKHVHKDKVYETVINKEVWVNKKAGGDGKDFIDRSKFRFSASLFFGTIRFGFDEDSFIGGIVKHKSGPVRAVSRSWVGMSMPLGMKSPRFGGDVYIYDTLILIGLETRVPFNPGYLLTDFKMATGYDLHHPNGYGMRWYNTHNLEGFLADGITSPLEAAYNDGFDKWRCIVGPNGWMVHRSLWDDYYFSQADIRVHYRDDIKHHNPPDYYPGDLAYYYVESTVTSLEARRYTYQLDWYWPYNFYDPEGVRLDIIEQIVNIRDNPIEIKIGSRQVTSGGGIVTLVEPQ